MVNKVILIGNLGQDPEVRYTPSGSAVATLSVATSRRWKDKDGQQQDETEWHRVIVWDKSADYCGNYLGKGDKVYVEGRLQTRRWKDAKGEERYTTEIVASTIQGLSSGGKESRGDNKQPQPPLEPFQGSTGEDVPF